jgi:hypothetical protein
LGNGTAPVGNKVDLVEPSTETGGESSSPASDEEGDDATATPDESARAEDGGDSSKRQVPREEAEEYAKENGLLFFETSAKTGQNVVEVFTEIGGLGCGVDSLLSRDNTDTEMGNVTRSWKDSVVDDLGEPEQAIGTRPGSGKCGWRWRASEFGGWRDTESGLQLLKNEMALSAPSLFSCLVPSVHLFFFLLLSSSSSSSSSSPVPISIPPPSPFCFSLSSRSFGYPHVLSIASLTVERDVFVCRKEKLERDELWKATRHPSTLMPSCVGTAIIAVLLVHIQ